MECHMHTERCMVSYHFKKREILESLLYVLHNGCSWQLQSNHITKRISQMSQGKIQKEEWAFIQTAMLMQELLTFKQLLKPGQLLLELDLKLIRQLKLFISNHLKLFNHHQTTLNLMKMLIEKWKSLELDQLIKVQQTDFNFNLDLIT